MVLVAVAEGLAAAVALVVLAHSAMHPLSSGPGQLIATYHFVLVEPLELAALPLAVHRWAWASIHPVMASARRLRLRSSGRAQVLKMLLAPAEAVAAQIVAD